MLVRIGAWALFGSVGAVVLWWAWHAENVAAFGRVSATLLVVLLIALPWVRGIAGPVGASRAARLVRWGGYALVCALIPVIVWVAHYANARFAGRADPAPAPGDVAVDVFAGVLRCLLIGGYAVAILRITSRRRAVAPTTLAAGGTLGVLVGLAGYGLTPLGETLPVGNAAVGAVYYLSLPVVAFGGPMLAGMLAARQIPDQDGQLGPNPAQAREGIQAGLITGILASLLITLCTICTMLLFPHAVTLEKDGPVYPPPDTPGERQMTIGDSAAGYQVLLLLGPGIGALAGLTGASIPRRTRTPQPTPA